MTTFLMLMAGSACSSSAAAPGDAGVVPVVADAAADGAMPGIIPGMAVGKFCHQLTHSGQPATLTLEVGDKTNFTRFVAVTGTCQPTVNMPCTAVPVGSLELRIKEGEVLLATRAVILHDGEEYLFEPGINSADGSLGIGGGPLLKGRCMGIDFVFPDGGAGHLSADANDGAPDSATD